MNYYETISQLETLKPEGKKLAFCEETGIIYYYDPVSGAYIDNINVLWTGKQGDTRWVNIAMSPFDSTQIDAFSRIRVSQPFNIFDSKQLNNVNNIYYWTSQTLGGGTITYQPTRSESSLSVGTASGDRATKQTKEYFNYQPGKSQLVLCTGKFAVHKENLRQRIGLFDNDNGIFYLLQNSGFNVVIRSNASGSVVDNIINQNNFNIDKLDGSKGPLNPSGITLDITKVHIFIINFQWLGVGSVMMTLDIGGKIIPVHRFDHSNLIDFVYAGKINLPIRYDIVNTDITPSSSTMTQICSSVISEGGSNPKILSRGINTEATRTVSTIYYPIISIRKKAANIRENVLYKELFLSLTTGDTVLFQIRLNPTLTGPSWTSAATNSFIEYDITSTALTGGDILYNGAIAGKYDSASTTLQSDFDDTLKILSNFSGTSDILTLCARSIAVNATLVGGINWDEVI